MRRMRLGVAVAVIALVAGSCGGGSAVTPSVPEVMAAVLEPGAAVEATIGPEGGEVSVLGAPGQPSYRLTVPPGALRSEEQLRVAPINSVDGIAYSGGFVGGVELLPNGQTFDAAVTLEIFLDGDGQERVRAGLDEGFAIFGFSYPGSGGPMSVDLAELDQGFDVIRLRLMSASGHGAGLGTAEDLMHLGRPADPAQAARYDIQQILYPFGETPANPNEPAVRADIAVVMRDWFAAAILPEMNAAKDLATFEAAVQTYLNWWELGRQFGLVTAFWFSSGDALEIEGLAFKGAALITYLDLVSKANEACKQTGDIASLMQIIDLNTTGVLTGLLDAETSAARLNSIMSPANFCVRLKIVAVDAPSELAEQASGSISFSIVSDRPGLTLTPQQLKSLRVAGTFDAEHPIFFDVAFPKVLVDGVTSRVEVPVTAMKAVDGQTDEGKVELGVTVYDLAARQATSTVTVDVTRENLPIVCAHSPGTTSDAIAVVFDGKSDCRVVTSWAENEPEMVLELDADEGEKGWDDDGFGANWVRDELGQNASAGPVTMTLTRAGTNEAFTLTLVVEISATPSKTTMTIRDVTITPTT